MMETPKYKLVKPSRNKYWLIRLTHPSPEGWVQKSTKQARRRDAERVAAQMVAGLLTTDSLRMTWKAFRNRYEADHLPTLRPTNSRSLRSRTTWTSSTLPA
jgi:hypothetical protein